MLRTVVTLGIKQSACLLREKNRFVQNINSEKCKQGFSTDFQILENSRIDLRNS